MNELQGRYQCIFFSFCRRYHACESLYNIVKVARGGCLPYFTHIFDALARLATDQEGSVRSGAEALDRLMKDIVSESPAFDLVSFMTMLRERIMTQSTAARQFLVGWVSLDRSNAFSETDNETPTPSRVLRDALGNAQIGGND